MAPGLNVCSASQCTGFLVIGSVKTAFGLGSMIGASTGRTKGPSVQLFDCASSWLAARKRMATMLMPDLRSWEAPNKFKESPLSSYWLHPLQPLAGASSFMADGSDPPEQP